jgi:pyochelin synthetase
MTSLLLQETILRNSRQTPHSAAIIGGSEVIGFNELKRRADELATTLKDRGVVAGDRVAIYMPKGVDAVIAVYGVLLAKAVYVPLDSRSPALRLSAVVEDSDCAAL